MKSGPRLLSARIDLTPLGLHLLHQMGRAEPESYLILQGCSYKDCNPVPWAAGSDRGNETQSTSEIILLPAVWWQRGGHVAGVCVCVSCGWSGHCGWKSSFTSMPTPEIHKLILGKWLWQGQEAQQVPGHCSENTAIITPETSAGTCLPLSNCFHQTDGCFEPLRSPRSAWHRKGDLRVLWGRQLCVDYLLDVGVQLCDLFDSSQSFKANIVIPLQIQKQGIRDSRQLENRYPSLE